MTAEGVRRHGIVDQGCAGCFSCPCDPVPNRKWVKGGRMCLGSRFEDTTHYGEEVWTMGTEVSIWDPSPCLHKWRRRGQGMPACAWLSPPRPLLFSVDSWSVDGYCLYSGKVSPAQLIVSANSLVAMPRGWVDNENWPSRTQMNSRVGCIKTLWWLCSTSWKLENFCSSPSRSELLRSLIWNALPHTYLSDNKWSVGTCSRGGWS